MDQFTQDDRDDREDDFTCPDCGGEDGQHDVRCPEYDEAFISAEERKGLDAADSENDARAA